MEIDATIELKPTPSLIPERSATITLTRPNHAPRTLPATYRMHNGRLLVVSGAYGLRMVGQRANGGTEVTPAWSHPALHLGHTSKGQLVVAGRAFSVLHTKII